MHDWSSRDRGLAEALTALEDQSCPGCNQKRSLAHDPETDGWWEHHEVVCNACAELERARKESKDPEPGAKGYVALDPEWPGLPGYGAEKGHGHSETGGQRE